MSATFATAAAAATAYPYHALQASATNQRPPTAATAAHTASPQKMAPAIRPGQYSRAPTQTSAPLEPHSPSKSTFRILSQGGGLDRSDGQGGRSIDPRTAPNKENNPPTVFAARPSSPSKPASSGFSIAKSNPVIDPKYRLRGNSPEDTQRTASSSRLKIRTASSSHSPSKGRARSRSRSRLFGGSSSRAASPEPIEEPPKTREEIDDSFVRLLDEMQVQPELRKKLLSLDSTVKLSMLKGQATLSLSGMGFDDSTSGSPTKSRQPIPAQMRKTKSSANLHDEHGSAFGEDDGEALQPPNRSQIFGGGRNSRSASGGSVSSSSEHSSAKNSAKRGSIDVFQGLRGGLKSPNLGQGGSLLSLQSTATGTGGRQRAMSFGKELALGKETPDAFAAILKSVDARRLDVDKVKRMRAVVSSESPAWISQFVGPECGGYDAMLVRLDELLSMEWREEQHDDKLLHELLRCFVALSTTEVGRGALQQQAPTPFKQLIDLLFSEKKPGELPTRKLMVDLVALVLDLQLPATAQSATSPLNFLLQLLQNPVDPAKEAVVDFIKQTHTPRPFKVYLTELASVCRDYFWVFCHSQNRYWRYEELDVETIKTPKVPGGMTGGVEFEAMGYLTTHFRLINSIGEALAQPAGHGPVATRPDMSAYDFHAHLFASGMERIVAHLRRSSQHYYSPMHLELARYISLATAARYALPHHITDWLMPSRNPAPAPTYQLGSLGTGYGFSGQFIHSLVPARQSSIEEEAASPQPSGAGGVRAVVASGESAQTTAATNAPAIPAHQNLFRGAEVAVTAHNGRASPTKDKDKDVSPPSPSKPYASGRWLANASKPGPAAPASTAAAAGPSGNLPNPHSVSPTTAQMELAPPRPLGRAAEDSVVGSAIKKWESRAKPAAAPNPSRAGLGLGWAS
ncbi:uncharacterized protein PFL1_05047 [Pseudozyma flocculosa PF-1]|uniref:Formin GTPase-binding domain-containing protein n=2 Tax=Pseudozyma flocculosa TaxID=84751 RepID=A0A5C3EWS6_9BASI|nr:uncharacterized protein PFL1_05047 [Pseudozyma flocculosa PF-1]EPQ27509.1 hypothetical protein PFL1_05047 [Pseudozyma flocculosa PF-1]SPO36056.1 uncharacterized protein PSFLO_01527 [Pseudozyma flocculosa]